MVFKMVGRNVLVGVVGRDVVGGVVGRDMVGGVVGRDVVGGVVGRSVVGRNVVVTVCRISSFSNVALDWWNVSTNDEMTIF